MPLVTQFLFIISYLWYVVLTVLIRVHVLLREQELTEARKADIAQHLQDRWVSKPIYEQLIYTALCLFFYGLFYHQIKDWL